MAQRIAFFDFDGTITTKDTLMEFIRFSKGSPLFYLGFLFTSPWIVAWKLKLISNQQAKEKVLAFFFKNYTLSRFQQECDRFSSTLLPGLIRAKALHEIQQLKDKDAAVIIVSASPENWIRGWADQLGLPLIATRLATTADTATADTANSAAAVNASNGSAAPGEPRLTGRISGANCHGQEKVRRIKEAYNLSDYTEIYAYGDSSGDKPMLQLATISFFKPFR